MIFEIIKDSLEYTFKDKSILKIGILSILSILIIPLFILFGYSYRTTLIGINSMINKEDPKPKFDNIKEMIVQGGKIIILCVYLLPVILATFFFNVNGLLYKIIPTVSGISIDFNFEILAILAIIGFICFIFISVAIPNMIKYGGSLKAGFKIKEIISIIKNVSIGNYILFWGTFFVIFGGLLTLRSFIVEFLTDTLFSVGITLTEPIILGIYIFILYFFIVPIFVISLSRGIALLYDMGQTCE